ncbi:ATP-binding cassette domain-containing protein [Anaerofustis stercorihominis]|uniref:ABC transporter ATP-binding protein n=1 Tax=Anaerofustis stercorihominis TaxID=214853 RepID=UPI00210BF4AD|nr:ABC transporter ATP-binding protein [Anaerofustis stercorihominis]MCQ4794688.1 ATP-binding cassette domain-containing protein [Anaerofustis stercorihominis]
MELIKAKNLTFSYPNSKEVLNDISFEINKGDFVLLFGKSGSGKSTLMKHLSVSLAPYGEKKGDILYKGKDINDLTIRERCEKIGYVSQNIEAQIITDKVWHELAFTLENLGYDNVTMKSRIAEMSSFFSMSQWMNRDTSALSGGEKQKLNLACSMLSFPEILLLDEPTSQLDPVMRNEFISLLTKINEEFGTTIIITEHSLSGIIDKADKCILLDGGKIKFQGNNLEMINNIIEKNNEYYDFLPSPVKLGNKIFDKRDVLTVKEAKKLVDNTDIKFKEIKNESFIRGNEIAIALKHIWFRYHKHSPDVIKDMSLKVYKGDFISVIGPNGAGKSTLLNILGKVIKPYRGKVVSTGKVAVLPQNPVSLFIKNTIRKDLEDISEDYISLVSKIGAENLLDSHPYDLSGGEIEIMALIKVLLVNPDILILDEPTKGMDVIYKDKIGKLLEGLNNNGVTIIVVSHDMEFISKYIPLSTIMFDGDIVSFKESRKLFGENYFYTTDINRITKERLDNAILLDEVNVYDK